MVIGIMKTADKEEEFDEEDFQRRLELAQSELTEFGKNSTYFHKNQETLSVSYHHKFVAIHNEKVVACADTPGQLRRKLRKLDLPGCKIGFVSGDKEALIL